MASVVAEFEAHFFLPLELLVQSQGSRFGVVEVVAVIVTEACNTLILKIPSICFISMSCVSSNLWRMVPLVLCHVPTKRNCKIPLMILGKRSR